METPIVSFLYGYINIQESARDRSEKKNAKQSEITIEVCNFI